MNIREFVESKDFDNCITLFLNVFNREPWNDNWSIEGAKQYLADYIHTPGFRGYIAEDDGVVQGFILGFRKRWWEGDEFYINEMCVQVDGQRRGIGTQLMKHVEHDLICNGIRNITLLTNRGIPAEKFYIKNGFQVIERLIFLHKRIENSSGVGGQDEQ